MDGTFGSSMSSKGLHCQLFFSQAQVFSLLSPVVVLTQDLVRRMRICELTLSLLFVYELFFSSYMYRYNKVTCTWYFSCFPFICVIRHIFFLTEYRVFLYRCLVHYLSLMSWNYALADIEK